MTMAHANWNAPKNITALSTSRRGGFSLPPYDSNNLAFHVGDSEHLVANNRRQLRDSLHLPNEPVWLHQTHSTVCVVPELEASREADASVTRSPKHPLVILTADCLPITLCNRQGTEIAAIHAGWKGLYHGIIEQTITSMTSHPSDILAWIGPAISQEHYETSAEIYEAFTTKDRASSSAFKPSNENKWFAHLALIAEQLLQSIGIHEVFQSNLCTFELKNEFFSYRRSKQTGRIATLIWFND